MIAQVHPKTIEHEAVTELARITCYNDLVEAFATRKAELQLSDATLDDVAGLTQCCVCLNEAAYPRRRAAAAALDPAEFELRD